MTCLFLGYQQLYPTITFPNSQHSIYFYNCPTYTILFSYKKSGKEHFFHPFQHYSFAVDLMLYMTLLASICTSMFFTFSSFVIILSRYINSNYSNFSLFMCILKLFIPYSVSNKSSSVLDTEIYSSCCIMQLTLIAMQLRSQPTQHHFKQPHLCLLSQSTHFQYEYKYLSDIFINILIKDLQYHTFLYYKLFNAQVSIYFHTYFTSNIYCFYCIRSTFNTISAKSIP